MFLYKKKEDMGGQNKKAFILKYYGVLDHGNSKSQTLPGTKERRMDHGTITVDMYGISETIFKNIFRLISH